MYLHTAPVTSQLFQRRLAAGLRSPLLLTGPAGTGKTTAVKTAIAEANCSASFRPFASGADALECGCPTCKKIQSGDSVDLLYLHGREPVATVRERVEDFWARPAKELEHRYLVLRNASFYTKSTMDSLLKLIESPPDHLFIYVTSPNSALLPPAIKSRCLAFQHPFLEPERLAQLVRTVPALTAHTKALGKYPFTSTRQLSTYSRIDLEAKWKLLLTSPISAASLEEHAKAFFTELAADPDYPPEESRPFALRFCIEKLFEHAAKNTDAAPGFNDLEMYLQSMLTTLQETLFANLSNPRSSAYINLEQQFISFFLAIFIWRKVCHVP